MGASSYVAMLTAALPAPRRAEVVAIADLEQLLATHDADARRAWPNVALEPARFMAHVATQLVERDEPAETVLRSLPAADLFLAAACAAGTPAAIAAFRDALVPTLRAALGKLGLPPATIDETVQRVMTMLFVGDNGPPQITTYRGRGTLRSWLRTVGVRTGRRLRGAEHAATPGDDELDILPGVVADPEVALLREQYRDAVRDAFAHAFASVDERQRRMLRQYHMDGLTIDQLGTLYRVNRATAARWVAAARLAVLEATRARLGEQLGISKRQVDSIVKLVQSHLDLSIRAITSVAPARKGRPRARRS